MSIFTKIGKAVKKGVKQISLKNLVKVGTPFLSMIPLVGGQVQQTIEGVSASAEAKKQAKIAEAQGQAELAKAYQAQADALAQTAGQNVGQQVGTVFNAFAKGATKEATAQISTGAKEVAGNIGADLADESIKSWIKKHMTALIVAGVALVAGVVIWWQKSKSKPKKKGW
ncbi:hypothetical protein [Flavobacterium algoritolerans]|uniref:Uncharacterized protein n=1 Tax=Flavobacterium algoritolerans TaxID=3041254 RepID=A0ABT6VC69_9FLAO|nr:hypothetical protein [Flavobacterium algoritolerans]MDI5895828.1 hypothetical protein [Flavobacterium algoritolerans]